MSSNSRIIHFGFVDHEEYEEKGKRKHRASCKFCKGKAPKLSEFCGTTSNFTRHLQRVHKAKWEEYLKGKTTINSSQQDLKGFFHPTAGSSTDGEAVPMKYKQTSQRQKLISAEIVKFIVGSSLPLSIVEDTHFRSLLQVLDPRYQPMARSTLTSKALPQLRAEGNKKVMDLLSQHNSISLTTDIWTDRTMHSYLGVTAHIMGTNPKTRSYGLLSVLLVCQHFRGRHTGERIAQAFDSIVEDYNIGAKVDFIVTDNAANMKKAFKVKFPAEGNEETSVDEEEVEEVEDKTVWEELDDEDDAHVDSALRLSSKQRIPCFAHTLQLVVNDGLKDMKCVSRAIAKVTKISTLLHKSNIFKERFENKFGVGRTIPAAVATRWNSQYHQLRSLLRIEGMDYKALAEVCDPPEFSNALLTRNELGQVTELCKILEPFAEATNLTQGDKSATITQVVPVVLDINSHLSKWKDDARVCKTLVTALHNSLKKRFRGIFINCGMDTEPGSGSHQEPFIEKIYLVGAVLDPQYMLHWVDADVVFTGSPENAKNKLKDTLKEMVITEAERFVSSAEEAASLSHTSSEEEDIPAKVPRLLAKYKTIRSRTKSGEKDSVRIQLEKYIRDEERHGLDAVTFWQDSGEGKNKYPSLHALAKNILCVPASSAPVERIFSRGGLIMRPHRARLTPQMLETLMFLKCNEHVL